MKLRLALITAVIMFGCLDNEFTNENINDFEGLIELGKQLKDPYTVESMEKALEYLINKKIQSPDSLQKSTVAFSPSDIDIEPNYHYIRFLPKGKNEAAFIIERDKDLVLFPYPLDYEIENEGSYYNDPSLEDSVIALYTAVPIGYNYSDSIEYEILKELFLIDPLLDSLETLGDNNSNSIPNQKTISLGKILGNQNQSLAGVLNDHDLSLQQLELTSLLLTGHLDDMLGEDDKAKLPQTAKISVEQIIGGGLWPDRWRPSGTLKFEDTKRTADQPVEGVRVTTGYWYYWRSSWTKFNGYFESPVKFSFKVRYKAHWDADDFVLQNGKMIAGHVVGIYHIVTWGSHKKSAWERTFIDNEARYAIIFTAAYFYYYKTIDGLARPKQDSIFGPRMDLEVYDGRQSEPGVHHSGFGGNSIEINLVDNNSYFEFDDLYGTTIHELAHSAHWANFETRYWYKNRSWEFRDMQKRLKESWARGVEAYLTKKRYNNYPVSYGGNYTGIVEDLMDTNINFANRGQNAGSEHVTNFKIDQIESAVLKSFSFEEWEENLVELYPSGTCVVWGYLWPNLSNLKCIKTITYTETTIGDLFQYWGD